MVILCAGLVADLDFLSANFGPSAYLRWNRTATHSMVFILVLALAAFQFSLVLRGNARVSWTGVSWPGGCRNWKRFSTIAISM